MLKLNNGLLLILLIGCIVILTACGYEYYLYHNAIRIETRVNNIELINYNNPTEQDNSLKIYPLNSEMLEILETLNTDSIDSFLVEIERIGGL